jgi:peroxiredoxin Q/BCP
MLARMGVTACVLGTFALVGGGLLCAGGNVGDKAPSFQATDDAGKVWKSSDHVRKKILVLYFYPADLTGGCTKQACGFRDDLGALAGKGVEVVGVSGDSVQNHKLFKKVHNLNFTLLADEAGEVAKTFGVPVGAGGTFKGYKDESGQVVPLTRGVTIQRYTVVIDRDGKVAAKYQVKDAAGDSKKTLDLVKKLEK